jgi:hypothetical protein
VKETTHLLPDLLPDDPGHFIAVELYDGMLDDDLLHVAVCDGI